MEDRTRNNPRTRTRPGSRTKAPISRGVRWYRACKGGTYLRRTRAYIHHSKAPHPWAGRIPRVGRDLSGILRALSRVGDRELGALLREYVVETEHNGWDGWPSRDIPGARSFLRDLILYGDL